MAGEPLQFVPYHQDPLAVLAKTILLDHSNSLPDLSGVTVLLAENQAAPALRQHLLNQAQHQGHAALLGPRILGLREWLMGFLSGKDLRICDPHLQILFLVEALLQHPKLIRSANPWALADDLAKLFDELTLSQVELPTSVQGFTEQLQHAYGLQEKTIDALGQEATLVLTLWHAWHEQLQAEGLTDRQAAYLMALSASLQQLAGDAGAIYISGFHRLHRCELDWLSDLLQQNTVCLFLHGEPTQQVAAYHPDSPLESMLQGLKLDMPAKVKDTKPALTVTLNSVFNSDSEILKTRTQRSRQLYTDNPLADQLGVFMASSAEEEARAVELQVRLWILQGKTRIGIVTENRRLARRVRALLERANIVLEDTAGWALSTTSAAASLERWLECIEEDFAHLPLLDLLKSPFIFPDFDRDAIQLATLRLEQDIILHENIARGLHRYRDHIRDRLKRLPEDFTPQAEFLISLIDRFAAAAEPLLLCIRQQRTSATNWLDAVHQSIARLGMDQALAEDPAGGRMLQALEQMQLAATSSQLSLDWLGLRTWLGRTLEQFHFQPNIAGHNVHLLGLGQSCLQHFDALVVAGVENEYLPGKANPSPFFNDAVRRELGLSASEEHLADRFHHFRRLLESADTVLITARKEQDGEPVMSSPWLDAIQAYSQLAWGSPLSAGKLEPLLASKATDVFRADTRQLPQRQQQPKPTIPGPMVPRQFSSSGYQQLLDCPYQFFAARCLKLAPSDEIRMALSKADYGERVHQCLQAFHQDVDELSGPYTLPFDELHREQAGQLLNEIAEAVFAQDLKDNFEHHGWLKQWKAQIPAYVAWQIERSQEWKIDAVEVKQRLELNDKLIVSGQLDRLESNSTACAVIDYKTGRSAKEQDMLDGEAIQLPVYALLAKEHSSQPVQQVGYLDLSAKQTVSMAYTLADDDLHQLSHAVARRLVSLVEELDAGQQLPAWGDKQACSWCDMALLCRKPAWESNDDQTGEAKTTGMENV